MKRDTRLQFDHLRRTYPTFVYEKFEYKLIDDEWLDVTFTYTCGTHQFTPSVQLPYDKTRVKTAADLLHLTTFFFHLGMVESISYYKAFCSPTVHIKAGFLNEKQQQWWSKLFLLGLGEFLYVNGIKELNEPLVRFDVERKTMLKSSLSMSDKVLVPIGGGKDSAVTLEVVKESNYRITPFAVNPRGAIFDTLKAAEIPQREALFVKRIIDPYLLELNKLGFLNGHTPFSAMLAFNVITVAALNGYSTVLLSNESSANEPTVAGTKVNHQYSKSWEFEHDFREYVAAYITEDINYLSFLRPLSELQIAAIFSTLTVHHATFKSCNVGSKEDRWCGLCSKCLFTYIMLSPFLTPQQLMTIFGKDLFNEPLLLADFNALIGKVEVKPFECVGTVEEVNLALAVAMLRFPELKETILLKSYSSSIRRVELAFKQALNDTNEVHALSSSQHALLMTKLKSVI